MSSYYPDLSKIQEVRCPDCGKPLIAVPVEDKPERYRFHGCVCNRELFELPDCIVHGIKGGPLFVYTEKAD